jgi:hypothetical protein
VDCKAEEGMIQTETELSEIGEVDWNLEAKEKDYFCMDHTYWSRNLSQLAGTYGMTLPNLLELYPLITTNTGDRIAVLGRPGSCDCRWPVQRWR